MNTNKSVICLNNKLWTIVFSAACLVVLPVLAGDLTTDNLTVKEDAEFFGNLEVKDPSTESAPTNGLVLYYSFSTNTTPVPDDSGNNHTGTVSGATWVTNGITGGAYSFDGSNDKIDVSGWQPSTGAGSFSASLWFKIAPVSTEYTALSWGATPGAAGIMAAIGLKIDDQKFQFNYGGASNPTSINPVDDNLWHHGIYTYDGSTLTCYLDGVYQSSQSVTLAIGAGNFAIGYRKPYNDGYWIGSLDEVRVYDRALTAAEVQSLYLYDAHLTAGSATFETGVKYVKPLGDLLMGSYTNNP